MLSTRFSKIGSSFAPRNSSSSKQYVAPAPSRAESLDRHCLRILGGRAAAGIHVRSRNWTPIRSSGIYPTATDGHAACPARRNYRSRTTAVVEGDAEVEEIVSARIPIEKSRSDSYVGGPTLLQNRGDGLGRNVKQSKYAGVGLAQEALAKQGVEVSSGQEAKQSRRLWKRDPDTGCWKQRPCWPSTVVDGTGSLASCRCVDGFSTRTA